jgi:hypothetical protein
MGVFPRGLNPDDKTLTSWLSRLHPNVKLLKKDQIPKHFHYQASDRIAPYVLLADEGWYLAPVSSKVPRGAHGFDPRFPSMHGIFVAAGPQLVSGARLPSFENLHVYALVAKLLGVDESLTKNRDADLKELRSFLLESNIK